MLYRTLLLSYLSQSSALLIGVTPRAGTASMSVAADIAPERELAEMYRARWQGETGETIRPRIEFLTPRAEEDVEDAEACIIVAHSDLLVEEQVCGKMSFDSTDEMVRKNKACSYTILFSLCLYVCLRRPASRPRTAPGRARNESVRHEA